MDAGALMGKNLGQLIVDAIAEVKRRSPEQIRTEIAEKGNAAISAKESMAVIAIIEEKTGCSDLLTPADLATPTTRPTGNSGRNSRVGNGCMDPAEDTSVNQLTQIICDKLGLSDGR